MHRFCSPSPSLCDVFKQTPQDLEPIMFPKEPSGDDDYLPHSRAFQSETCIIADHPPFTQDGDYCGAK